MRSFAENPKLWEFIKIGSASFAAVANIMLPGDPLLNTISVTCYFGSAAMVQETAQNPMTYAQAIKPLSGWNAQRPA